MISVIIPAHNEEQYLTACIKSVNESAAASEIPIEVIVVDDASTDKTVSIAEKEGCSVISVRYESRAKTRNAGARAAVGEIITFIDADTVISQELFKNTYELLQNDKHQVIWYRQDALENVFIPRLYFFFANFISRRHPPFSPVISITQKYFLSGGTFNEQLESFEDLYYLRTAWKKGVAQYCPASLVKTSIRRITTFGYLRYFAHAIAAAYNPYAYKWKAVGGHKKNRKKKQIQ